MIRKTYTHAITSPTALSVHTSYPYHTCPCKTAGRACYIATNREHKLQMGANCQILVFTITLSKLNIEYDQWHVSGK